MSDHTADEIRGFIVPGPPEPWRRTRSAGRRRFPDPRGEAHADRIRWAWRDAGSPQVGDRLFALAVYARFTRPASHLTTTGALSATGKRSPNPSRIDVDNVAKAVMDALNGLAWTDDRQCTSLLVMKRWVMDEPATRVEFWPVDDA